MRKPARRSKSSWLDLSLCKIDPNNSNALTTNTTNISYLTRNITGPSTVCSLNATYAVTNLPSGQVVNWTFSPNLIYVSGQGTNQLVVKSSDGDPLPLVSLSYDNYGSSGWVRAGTCNNVVLEKTIWVGLPAYTPIVTGSSTMFCSQSLYVEKYNRNAAWSVYGPLQVIGVNYGYKCTVKGTESGVGWVYATNSNLCGSFRGEKLVQVTCSSYSVFPNPTNSEVTISLLPDNSIDKSFQKDKSIKSIRVVDKSGITLSTDRARRLRNASPAARYPPAGLWRARLPSPRSGPLAGRSPAPISATSAWCDRRCRLSGYFAPRAANCPCRARSMAWVRTRIASCGAWKPVEFSASTKSM